MTSDLPPPPAEVRLTRDQLADLTEQTLLHLRLESVPTPAPMLMDLPQVSPARRLMEKWGLLRYLPGVLEGRWQGQRPALRDEEIYALSSVARLAQNQGWQVAMAAGVAAPARANWAKIYVDYALAHDLAPQPYDGDRVVTVREAQADFQRLVLRMKPPPPLETLVPAVLAAPSVLHPEPTAPVEPTVFSLPSFQPLSVGLFFHPELLHETGSAGGMTGYGTGSVFQAQWRLPSMLLSGEWTYQRDSLRRSGSAQSAARQEHQIRLEAGFRHDPYPKAEWALLGETVWRFRRPLEHQGASDLLTDAMSAFGLGLKGRFKLPLFSELALQGQFGYTPAFNAEFGDKSRTIGQLGEVTATLGLQWQIQNLWISGSYGLRTTYDAKGLYNSWGNGLLLGSQFVF